MFDYFNNTKYTKWYSTIVNNALSLERSKNDAYYEEHHILPKSIFPQFSCLKENSWNSVLLTAREHFIVHLLLVKCVKTKNERYKMLCALNHFKKFRTSQQYDSFKQEWSFLHSERLKGNKFRSTPEGIEKMKKKAKERMNGPQADHYRQLAREGAIKQHLEKPFSKEHFSKMGKIGGKRPKKHIPGFVETHRKLQSKYIIKFPDGNEIESGILAQEIREATGLIFGTPILRRVIENKGKEKSDLTSQIRFFLSGHHFGPLTKYGFDYVSRSSQ